MTLSKINRKGLIIDLKKVSRLLKQKYIYFNNTTMPAFLIFFCMLSIEDKSRKGSKLLL